jgi:RHS repeat-associated protein
MPGRYEKGSPPTEEDFTGHVKDNSTGLHYAGARYYSSAFARWNAVDPLAPKFPSTSPYAYVLNNPMRYVDPTGRDTTVKVDKSKRTDPEDAPSSITLKGEGSGAPENFEEIVVTAESSSGRESGRNGRRAMGSSAVALSMPVQRTLAEFIGQVGSFSNSVGNALSQSGAFSTAVNNTVRGAGLTGVTLGSAYDIYLKPTGRNIAGTLTGSVAGYGVAAGGAALFCGTGVGCVVLVGIGLGTPAGVVGDQVGRGIYDSVSGSGLSPQSRQNRPTGQPNQ